MNWYMDTNISEQHSTCIFSSTLKMDIIKTYIYIYIYLSATANTRITQCHNTENCNMNVVMDNFK
jgi:cytidylate kinase